MALLQSKSFKYVNKERNIIHEPVDAEYTKFTKDGRKFFQIDTFGTSKRKMRGKTSQSLQLDEEAAKMLASKLNEVFGLK